MSCFCCIMFNFTVFWWVPLVCFICASICSYIAGILYQKQINSLQLQILKIERELDTHPKTH